MAKLSGIKRFFGKVGRRNWIILSAVLLIGAAVYLNYLWFYDPADSVGYGDNNAVGAGAEANDGADAAKADPLRGDRGSANRRAEHRREQ